MMANEKGGEDVVAKPLIQVCGLRKEYPMGDETVVALKKIDLAIE